LASALLLLGAGRVAVQATSTSDGPATKSWVVQPGETLWSVAQHVEPGADPRETVLRIEQLNGLTSADVTVGQHLVVPRS
jgi:LysM repeat protein